MEETKRMAATGSRASRPMGPEKRRPMLSCMRTRKSSSLTPVILSRLSCPPTRECPNILMTEMMVSTVIFSTTQNGMIQSMMSSKTMRIYQMITLMSYKVMLK